MTGNESPLANLRRQIDLLAAMPLSASAAAAVAEADAALCEIEHASAWLSPAAAARIWQPIRKTADAAASPVNLQVFEALLDVAGPVVTPELLTQMATDLRMIAQFLGPALAAHDRPTIRIQCHNLTAIAGAAGAVDLQLAAGHLGDLARSTEHETEPDAALTQQGGLVQTALNEVIAFIDSHIKQRNIAGQDPAPMLAGQS